uniref:Uncharacterized protein n=1 Tax=Heterorhabditis bacteriophora TaxID=37862 RepID=A0A1I7WX60_HETBA
MSFGNIPSTAFFQSFCPSNNSYLVVLLLLHLFKH